MFKYDDEAYWVVAYPDVYGDLEDLVWVNQCLAKECLEAARASSPTDALNAARWATDCSGLGYPLATPMPPTHDGERRRMLYYLLFLHNLRDSDNGS